MKLLITTSFFFLMQGLYTQEAEQEITNTEKVTGGWVGGCYGGGV